MKRVMLGVVGVLLAAFATLTGQGQAQGTRPAATDAAFDAEYARLQRGPDYEPQRAGVHEMFTTINGVLLDNTLIVPEGYDPARRWPLRVQLHGGVGRPAPRPGEQPQQAAGGRGGLTTNRIPTDEPALVLQPRAYRDMEWWRSNQVDNILRLVADVKRRFNVDENRVSLAGISDGGTGVWFWAMRQSTPFAHCLILISHPLVLANPQVGAEQQLYPVNAASCPVFAVNGGRDPLYPADSVVPFVRMYQRAGLDIEHHIHPDAGHNTSWWPEERPLFERWASARVRNPHPERVSWETDRTDRYNRAYWLVIDELGRRSSDASLLDVNSVETRGGGRQPVFSRTRPGGRVDVVRSGNRFDAQTRGVAKFTLLLSPEVVDFTRPVTVVVNGRQVFSGTIAKSLDTLRRWNERDRDRTMLYAAELPITVP